MSTDAHPTHCLYDGERYPFRRGVAAAEAAHRRYMDRKTIDNATDRSNPSALLSAAVDYVQRGIPILPLLTRGKTPTVTGGWKAATTNGIVLREWLDFYADREPNIGIPTGHMSRWVVVDVDGPTGLASLKKWEEANGVLPKTRTARSGRPEGGWHFYFCLPDELPATTPLRGANALLGPGVDVLADGKFVVAPPSVHDSGAVYYWEDLDIPFAVLPPVILDMLIERGKPRVKKPREVVDRPEKLRPSGVSEAKALQPGRGHPYGLAALRSIVRELAECPEGGRDDKAFWSYVRIGKFVGSGVLDSEYALSMLADAMDANGLGSDQAKLVAFERGFDEAEDDPIVPPAALADTSTITRDLSQFDEVLKEPITWNWDIALDKLHDTTNTQHITASPFQGPHRDGPFSKIATAKYQPCSFPRHVIIRQRGGKILEVAVRCTMRKCDGCHRRELLATADRIIAAIQLRPNGLFSMITITEGRWSALRKAFSPQRGDVDFAKIPAPNGFVVLAYSDETVPKGLVHLADLGALLDELTTAWLQIPAQRKSPPQKRFSPRWRDVEKPQDAGGERLGLTVRAQQLRRNIEAIGGTIKRLGPRLREWKLPRGITAEQIIANERPPKSTRRLRRSLDASDELDP